MRRHIVVFPLVILLLATPWVVPDSAAEPPPVMSYQGTLFQSDIPYTGIASFKFAMVVGGTVTLWSNDGTSTTGDQPLASVPIEVSNGAFFVALGDPGLGMSLLEPHLFEFAPPPMLRIWVNTSSGFEQLDDVPVHSSLFAICAETANRSIGDFLVEGELHTLGGIRFPDDTVQMTASTGSGDNDWVISGSDMYSGVTGNIGIGLSTPSWPLHVATDDTTGFVDEISVFVHRTGTANPEIGIVAIANAPSGIALLGESTTNGATAWISNDGNLWAIGQSAAVLGDSGKDDGYGVWGYATNLDATGVHGDATGTGGIGVGGQATASSGENHGGWFESSSADGFGLHAETASTSASTLGPCAIEAEGGTAIRGESTTTNGNGVVGIADGPNGWAVYGNATGGGYAGFFDGNLQVVGDFTVAGGSKSFLIDHPFDPANKYLAHACIESDERVNMYRGNVQLDAKGQAWVDLPEWFESVNADFSYHLTAVGAPAPQLHVAREVQNGQFAIGGGEPGMKVSWTVSAVRSDEWARANPMVVERDKASHERGYYLTPAAFGLGKEQSTVQAKADMSVAGVSGPPPARPVAMSDQEAHAKGYSRRPKK